MDREDLHNELQAVIAAARELPPENEAVLIDSFLDGLERRADTRIGSYRPPTTGAHLRASPRWIPAVLLLALLPFFASGNRYVVTDGRFWCVWALTAVFVTGALLAHTLGFTLNFGGLMQRSSSPDDFRGWRRRS